MRARAARPLSAILTGIAVAALAACSSSPPPYHPPTHPPSSTKASATPAPTPSRQVLAIADLPQGWTGVRDLSSVRKSLPSCVLTAAKLPEAKDTAHAGFAQGATFPYFLEDVGYFSDSAAKSAYDTAKKALDGCSKATYKVKKRKLTGSLDNTSFDTFGDASTAYTGVLSGDGPAVTLFCVIMRRGDSFATFTYVKTRSGTIQAFQYLVKTATDKIAAH